MLTMVVGLGVLVLVLMVILYETRDSLISLQKEVLMRGDLLGNHLSVFNKHIEADIRFTSTVRIFMKNHERGNVTGK